VDLRQQALRNTTRMLTEKVKLLYDNSEVPESEDIFSNALTFLFPDETRNQHGDPGSAVAYRNSRFGDLKLQLADPAAVNNGLFAHYLWNAGVMMAELVSASSRDGATESWGQQIGEVDNWDVWDMTGQTVLELGAGGTAFIVSVLPDQYTCFHVSEPFEGMRDDKRLIIMAT
jgi:hypothetical protein